MGNEIGNGFNKQVNFSPLYEFFMMTSFLLALWSRIHPEPPAELPKISLRTKTLKTHYFALVAMLFCVVF